MTGLLPGHAELALAIEQGDLDISHGHFGRLVAQQLHAIVASSDRWQLNLLPAPTLALGAQPQTLVPNPFAGVITTGPLSLPNVTRAQLLRPYPQFLNVLDFRAAAASSIYHAAQAKLQKRFANGATFLIATPAVN